MQIKQQALAQQLQKNLAPLYLLIGQDNFLLDEAMTLIKKALRSKHDCEEKILTLQNAEDWAMLAEEANSYSLFSETVLLSTFFDKKTLDASGKKVLTDYLSSINSRCFIIIKAPDLPAKQIQWLTNHEHVVVVVAYPMTADAMKQWIVNQLRSHSIPFDQEVPDVIQQYTQGNMLACAQVIEKITLSNQPNTTIDTSLALEHLSDQCEHSLYELIDSCLLGRADKSIQMLRQAANNKTESTLVLWMFTQEVRLLLQLTFLSQQVDFKAACSQLKIWPQKVALYHSCIKRLKSEDLQQLLHYCQLIDERIKSSLNTQVWNSLEYLVLSLCLGKLVGDACAA